MTQIFKGNSQYHPSLLLGGNFQSHVLKTGGSRGGVVGVKKNEYLGTQSFYCIYLPGELTMFLVKNDSLYMTLSAQFQMLILVSLFS